jgi:pyruvate formate lyase activating enzyme
VALTQDVQRTLAHTDLVLLDIKQIDSVRHEALTGMSNEYTLAMARYLSDNKIPMRVRYVVVPGYTDAAEDVARLADFLKEMRNLERVELLPYHMLGKHKWEMMGVPYELNGVPTPSSAQMTAIASAFASRGIAASHGQ